MSDIAPETELEVRRLTGTTAGNEIAAAAQSFWTERAATIVENWRPPLHWEPSTAALVLKVLHDRAAEIRGVKRNG